MKSKTRCPKCESAVLSFENYGKEDMRAFCPNCDLSVLIPNARLFMGEKERMKYVRNRVVPFIPEVKKVEPYARLKRKTSKVKS